MPDDSDYYPKQIVCLTEESTELLYLLGEEDRIAGISVFTKRPPKARKEKPKVSAFVNAKIDKILELKPDLVIGFSDIQADIAKELISKGITVWVNNHRSVKEILNMMVQLGSIVGKEEETIILVEQIKQNIARIRSEVSDWKCKPRVYFEEWYDPLITGIRWVGEIIELAGGINIFPELSREPLGKDRIISNPSQVAERDPDIILASWCGQLFKKERMLKRNGWSVISAIKTREVYEIKSEIILQPGPAALMDGLPLMNRIFKSWKDKYEKT